MVTKKAKDESTQVNVRMPKVEAQMLLGLINAANAKARSVGLPDEVTAASLIRMWIRDAAYKASLVSIDAVVGKPEPEPPPPPPPQDDEVKDHGKTEATEPPLTLGGLKQVVDAARAKKRVTTKQGRG